MSDKDNAFYERIGLIVLYPFICAFVFAIGCLLLKLFLALPRIFSWLTTFN